MNANRIRRCVWLTVFGVAIVLPIVGYTGWILALNLHERMIEYRLNRYHHLIAKHAKRSTLSDYFIRAVIIAESGGNPFATSRKGARGLMQIRPGAEQDALGRLKIKQGDLSDPNYNILIGTTYLKILYDQFNGDYPLVATAYHLGPSRMREIIHEHPDLSSWQLIERHVNPTTRTYVYKVFNRK